MQTPVHRVSGWVTPSHSHAWASLWGPCTQPPSVSPASGLAGCRGGRWGLSLVLVLPVPPLSPPALSPLPLQGLTGPFQVDRRQGWISMSMGRAACLVSWLTSPQPCRQAAGVNTGSILPSSQSSVASRLPWCPAWPLGPQLILFLGLSSWPSHPLRLVGGDSAVPNKAGFPPGQRRP